MQKERRSLAGRDHMTFYFCSSDETTKPSAEAPVPAASDQFSSPAGLVRHHIKNTLQAAAEIFITGILSDFTNLKNAAAPWKTCQLRD